MLFYKKNGLHALTLTFVALETNVKTNSKYFYKMNLIFVLPSSVAAMKTLALA